MKLAKASLISSNRKERRKKPRESAGIQLPAVLIAVGLRTWLSDIPDSNQPRKKPSVRRSGNAHPLEAGTVEPWEAIIPGASTS
jgi:hypothetical protein